MKKVKGSWRDDWFFEGICWNLDLDLDLTREKVVGREVSRLLGGRLLGGWRVEVAGWRYLGGKVGYV